MFRRPNIDVGDTVSLIGVGPVGVVLKIRGRFVVTQSGAYPRICLLVIRKKCNCGRC